MRIMPQHLAGSTAYVRVDFVDRNGAPAAPSSATYSITDVDTGAEIRAATPIGTPGASVELVITPAETAIHTEGRALERRLVRVVGTYGVDDVLVTEYVLLIKAQQ